MAVAAGNGGDGPEEGVGESSSPPHDPAPAPVPAPAASGGSGGGVRGGGLRDICREVFERLVNDGYLAGSELLAQLEALFNRLPMSHKLDVNIDKAEDVLIHQKVLAEAKDPDRRPAFAVRFLRLEEVNVDETTNSDAHEEGADIGEALSTRYDGCMLEVSRTKGFPLSTSKNPNSVLPSPSMMQKIHKVTKVLPDFNPDTKDFLINNTRRMVLQPLKICDEDEDDSGNEFLSSAKLPKSGNCTTHIDDELVPKNSKKFCFDNLDDGCLLEVSGTKGSLLSTSKNPNSVLPSPSMMQKIHKVFSDEEIEDILSQWINNPHYLLPSNVYSIDIYTKE